MQTLSLLGKGFATTWQLYQNLIQIESIKPNKTANLVQPLSIFSLLTLWYLKLKSFMK